MRVQPTEFMWKLCRCPGSHGRWYFGRISHLDLPLLCHQGLIKGTVMAQAELWRWYISPVCVMQVYIQRYLKTVQSDDTDKVEFYRVRPIYHAYGSCFVVFYCELQPVGFTDIHHGYLALVGQIIPHIETLMDIGKSITKKHCKPQYHHQKAEQTMHFSGIYCRYNIAGTYVIH